MKTYNVLRSFIAGSMRHQRNYTAGQTSIDFSELPDAERDDVIKLNLAFGNIESAEVKVKSVEALVVPKAAE